MSEPDPQLHTPDGAPEDEGWLRALVDGMGEHFRAVGVLSPAEVATPVVDLTAEDLREVRFLQAG